VARGKRAVSLTQEQLRGRQRANQARSTARRHDRYARYLADQASAPAAASGSSPVSRRTRSQTQPSPPMETSQAPPPAFRSALLDLASNPTPAVVTVSPHVVVTEELPARLQSLFVSREPRAISPFPFELTRSSGPCFSRRFFRPRWELQDRCGVPRRLVVNAMSDTRPSGNS